MLPLIINLAPTGMVPTKAQSPHLPLASAEIAADCAEAVTLGATMLHLHARDADGEPSCDPHIIAELIARVRAAAPGAVIVATTSGRRVQAVESRASCLWLEGDAKPDMASLTLSSLNFASEASLNPPQTIMRLASIMQERGIRPELEVFDLGMVNFAKILIDKGLLQPPFYFNILLGNAASAQASLLHLGALVADLPPQSIWSVGGIGRFQTQAVALGVALGHGIRTGLEDNLWLDQERSKPASNAQLLARAVALAKAQDRAIATAAEVRSRLGLEARHA